MTIRQRSELTCVCYGFIFNLCPYGASWKMRLELTFSHCRTPTAICLLESFLLWLFLIAVISCSCWHLPSLPVKTRFVRRVSVQEGSWFFSFFHLIRIWTSNAKGVRSHIRLHIKESSELEILKENKWCLDTAQGLGFAWCNHLLDLVAVYYTQRCVIWQFVCIHRGDCDIGFGAYYPLR